MGNQSPDHGQEFWHYNSCYVDTMTKTTTQANTIKTPFSLSMTKVLDGILMSFISLSAAHHSFVK